MNLSLTLNFTSIEQAMRALAALPADVVIAPEDRPESGVDVRQIPLAFGALPPAQPNAAQVFGGAVAPAAPPMPAPSTAAAAASSTAPVAAPGGAPLPPSAAQPPAPPLAPAAPAPTAPAAPASPAGIEVDADGLPWDARIHANSKDGPSKNEDGRWRKKRGLNDPALKQRVEAELRQAMAAGLPPVAPPAPPQPPVLAAPPAPPAPPQAPVLAAPPAPPAAETFATLMVKIQAHKAAGRLSDDQVAGTLGQLGLSALGQLATRADLVPAVGAMIDALVPA